jgi:hypothetical protein
MLVALAGALGLYCAGRVIPHRLARASRWLERDVRPWAVIATTIVAAVISTLAVDLPQNWASVVALALAPLAVAAGAYWPRLVPSGLRAYAAVVVLALGLPIAMVALGGGMTSTSGVDVEELTPAPSTDRHLAHIGPQWHAMDGWDDPDGINGQGWSRASDGRIEWHASFPTAVFSELNDLRLEAWRTDREGFAIDRSFEAPFATAVPVRRGTEVTASIDTQSEPGVEAWDLVLTGVGPDGVRYVVSAGAGGTSTFTGSVWDWVTAVIDD